MKNISFLLVSISSILGSFAATAQMNNPPENIYSLLNQSQSNSFQIGSSFNRPIYNFHQFNPFQIGSSFNRPSFNFQQFNPFQTQSNFNSQQYENSSPYMRGYERGYEDGYDRAYSRRHNTPRIVVGL